MEGTEKYITPNDASIKLGIGDSTLCKWCLLLESHGFFFREQTINGNRSRRRIWKCCGTTGN
ncbi:hypothetical protein CUU64_21075 [Bacillus sp. V5-8f]|nr:hypothetical protein CUU64_21075 [Bacillus sp. V5-8f]